MPGGPRGHVHESQKRGRKVRLRQLWKRRDTKRCVNIKRRHPPAPPPPSRVIKSGGNGSKPCVVGRRKRLLPGHPTPLEMSFSDQVTTKALTRGLAVQRTRLGFSPPAFCPKTRARTSAGQSRSLQPTLRRNTGLAGPPYRNSFVRRCNPPSTMHAPAARKKPRP